MNWKLTLKSALVVTALSVGLSLGPAANAQSPKNPNVSVVQLMVQPGPNGTQLVLTPKGYLVPMPGPGVNGNTIDLYFGAQGGYWYVDKNGKTNDITNYVNQVRTQSAQMQTVQTPQYAPAPYYNNPNDNNSNYNNSNYNNSNNSNSGSSSTSSTSSGSSSNSGSAVMGAVGTAAAAGMGAMVGSSVAHYNNVPYGTPLYYHNNNPYYRDVEGKGVFLDDGDVQWDNVAKGKHVQNNRQQAQINEAKANQAQRSAGRDAQQSQRQTEMDTNQKRRQASLQDQSQQFSNQQNWYQEQGKDKGRAQAWQQQSSGDNPFVRSQDGGQRGGREASGEGFGGRGERGGGGLRERGGGGGGREFGGRGGGGARGGGGGRRGR